MRKKFKMIVFAVCMSAILAIPMGVAFAATGANVTIGGKHIITNYETLKTGTHTFVLTAKDKSNPMPEGSSNGTKKVTISSNNDFSFGGMTFTTKGTYNYTVSREVVESQNLVEDDSVYNITVYISSNGTPTVIYKKVGTDGKVNAITYKDKYVEPTPTNPTEPTNPTNPTEPTNPTNPTDPTEITDPTDEPDDPTEATDPEDEDDTDVDDDEDDDDEDADEDDDEDDTEKSTVRKIIDKIAKTGDEMPLLKVAVPFGLSIIIIGIVIFLKRRNKKEETDEE